MTILFNNINQIIALLVFFTLIFIWSTKFKFYFNTSFQQRNKKVASIEANNLTLEKILIIALQFLIVTLNQKIVTTALMTNFASVLILFLHAIICFSFLIKRNEKIKFWNNLYNLKFIILVTIILFQLLFLTWQFQDLVFFNKNSSFWLITFNSIYLFITYKVFNQAWSLTKYLTLNTYKILIAKRNSNFYFNQKKIFNLYSKTQAIANLWNFENLNLLKEMNDNSIKEKNIKAIKNNWVLFIIGLTNLFCNNTIKTQKIIINGWKISLVE